MKIYRTSVTLLSDKAALTRRRTKEEADMRLSGTSPSMEGLGQAWERTYSPRRNVRDVEVFDLQFVQGIQLCGQPKRVLFRARQFSLKLNQFRPRDALSTFSIQRGLAGCSHHDLCVFQLEKFLFNALLIHRSAPNRLPLFWRVLT